jgi:phage protein D
MPPQPESCTFKIELDGIPLADAVDSNVVSVLVDDSLNLPDLFSITFRDPDREILKDTGAKIGSLVQVRVVSDTNPSGQCLIVGEVTALEAEFDTTGSRTVVRGFDRSHRLFRGRSTKTWEQATASDVASEVAKSVGLEIGTVDATDEVKPFISQGNVTHWQLLKALASEVGYEVGVFDGKFDFRKPAESSAGPEKGDLSSEEDRKLVCGHNLLRFRAMVTSGDQVTRVTVRGWDMMQKDKLVHTVPAETTAATLSVAPMELAAVFGDPEHVGVDVPYVTQAEVETAAYALADRIAGGFAEFEGVARGNTALRAGALVSVGLVGEPFDGSYTLTSTRHSYTPQDGYVVMFTVSGRQDRSLFSLAGGNERDGMGGPAMHGVVSAQVTDVNDEEDLGRVRLKFPWLSDTYVSDWARVVQAGAGNQRGAVVLPEVNDEVLVSFDRGDLRRPFVLGGLHNGTDMPMLGDDLIDGTFGGVRRRGFISKQGAGLVFFDDERDQGVAMLSGDRGLRVSLNQSEMRIRISSQGDIEIQGDGNLSIKARNALTIEAGSSMKLKAPTIELN